MSVCQAAELLHAKGVEAEACEKASAAAKLAHDKADKDLKSALYTSKNTTVARFEELFEDAKRSEHLAAKAADADRTRATSCSSSLF